MATQQQPENSTITTFTLTNVKSGQEVDVKEGTPVFSYYENILSNHITASCVLIETGFSIEGKDGKLRNIVDGLPLRGGEAVQFEAEDKAGNIISFKGEKKLYVNRVSNVIGSTKRLTYALNFCTKEFLANEQTRVVKRYKRPKKISEHVIEILKNVLKTQNYREEDIEETQQSYEFIGNDRKPFHIITWLANKSIPADGTPGASSGFFFFETQDGFQFKSIDGLLSDLKPSSGDKKIVKRFKYKGTNFEDADEKGTILSYNVDNTIDLQSNLQLGTYTNRTLFFDPWNFKFEIQEYKIDEKQFGKVKTGGKEDVDYVPEEFRAGPTRLLWRVKDNGALPTGATAAQQLESWKSEPEKSNDEMDKNTVQSVMRYNQMFTYQLSITVSGDFALRAGETVFCEFPDVSETGDVINDDISGHFVIASLCHQISSDRTITSMTLIRDSYGKKALK